MRFCLNFTISNCNSRIFPAISASLSLCVILLFLVSCQTVPKIPDAFLQEAQFAPLNSGALVYIFADVKNTRSVLELLPIEELNDRRVMQMLDRTDFALAAFFPDESEQHFQLAAWGNYPNSQARFAFGLNKGWKKHRSQAGGSYWYSSNDKLSIALSSRQAFVTSSVNNTRLDPKTSAPGVRIPEGFNAFRRENQGVSHAFLSCWLEQSANTITQMLNDAGVPIRFPVQQLFINLYNADNGAGYEAVMRFQLENNSQARGMAALLNLASGFISDDIIIKLFMSNPAIQNGVNLDIKTAVLTAAEITELFNMLSVF